MNTQLGINISYWTMIVLSTGILGCFGGSGDQVELGTVSGVVTMDGKPLPDAIVVFSPIEKGNPSTGRTDASGNYVLKYLNQEKGAIIGKHQVIITAADPIDATATGADETLAVDFPPPDGFRGKWIEPRLDNDKQNAIPEKYNAKSELSASVTDGSNTHDFALESK